uniref:Retrotransposon gag domain-containing protein n=1 Tax=Pygocentrus nattereri TaxID=42514 RepID=A0AAR2IRM3_PYGNA
SVEPEGSAPVAPVCLSVLTSAPDSVEDGLSLRCSSLSGVRFQNSELLGDLGSFWFYLSDGPCSGTRPLKTPNPKILRQPDKFSCDPDQCRGFLLQCSVFFDNSPVATDQAKISFVVSRLAGKALDWATASWSSFSNWTYACLLKEFRLVFDHPIEGRVSGERLAQFRQGSHSVVEYALEFRTLAASSGWNEFLPHSSGNSISALKGTNTVSKSPNTE